MRRTVERAALIAGLVLRADASRADDLAEARAHFAEAVHRFELGDFEGARQLFLRADREHHVAVLSYNLARTEERLGHPQAAVDAYERYLAEAGASGEFAQAAAVASAEVRSRAGRVRIESQPPDARVFVDGTPLTEATPTALLLPAGKHHVVVEGDGWRAASDFDAKAGAEQTVSLARAEPAGVPPPVAPPKAESASAKREAPVTESAASAEPSGLVGGAAFVVVPYDFFGSDQAGPNHGGAVGVDVGLTGEIGYTFAPRAEILLRGVAALGSECKSFTGSHFLGAGPAIAYRLASALWVGASLVGGNAQTCRGTSTYSTDIVFSPSLDIAVAVSTHAYGQWVISASVAYFFANPANDNRVLYVPIGFGVRFF